MNVARLRQAMSDFHDTLEELEEALTWIDVDKPYRDSTILRFMLVYELAWKTLMYFSAEVGRQANSPRDAFKQAYQQHWIDDQELWLRMIEDRNLVVHTYNERLAEELYERIKTYAPALRRAHTFLRDKFGDILGNRQ